MRFAPVALLSCLLAFAGCKADQANRRSSDIDVAAAASAARARAASKPLSHEEAARVDDGRPVIACFGDSITAGYGTAAGESYPDDLQRLLDQAGYRYRVVNLGVSGNTTKDGLDRVDRVMSLSPAITVVEFGGNDGLRGIPVANTRKNLDQILDKLAPTRTQIVLAGITLPPQFGQEYVRSFDETYHLAAEKHRIPLLPFIYKDVYGVPGYIQPDGVHATAAGNRQVAKNIFNMLQPLLKK
ncbi:MAG: arylesterase [Acidobacteria bacterium]|nr:arylesterase [Acidobacteriota bacterium]